MAIRLSCAWTSLANSTLVLPNDAEAADIYAAAYSGDAGFYQFLKTMEVLRQTLDSNTVLVLGTDSEFLRYLGRSR